uniref:Phosphoesterase n=1 Tax=Staphylothermus marinus TaxID=2280 RepID=A0A7C4D7S8_STAMA
MKYVIVAHTDIDGVSASALYDYFQNNNYDKVIYVEPYHLNKLANTILNLKNIDKIVFTDLGLNDNVFNIFKNTLAHLKNRNIEIEWYDHHVWNDEWITEFNNIGVKLFIDRSTCAVGVVAKYAPRVRESIDDNFVNELVNGVCSADLFRFDHKLGPWFYRLVRRRSGDDWRKYVFEKISNGVIWCSEFTDKVIELFDKEINEYNNIEYNIELIDVNGLKIGFILNNEYIESSLLASYVLSKYSLDVAIVASIDGKLSIRSRKYNVRNLAYKLGGGGHIKASGAKVKIPIGIRIKGLVNKQTVLKHISKIVSNAIYELGGLDRIE